MATTSVRDMATAATGDMATAATVDMATGGDMTSAGTTVTVNVGQGGSKFDPQTVNIHVGDTVKWVWMGSNHNVVSGTNGLADGKFCSPTDMSCDTAPLSNVGATYSHKFTLAGSYPYFCRPHFAAGMTGTVTVQ